MTTGKSYVVGQKIVVELHAGEVAAFRMANMARQMNNNNLFTYSTKIMAATDDAFAYILVVLRCVRKLCVESWNYKVTMASNYQR